MVRFARRVLDPDWSQGEQDGLKARVAAYLAGQLATRQNTQPFLKKFGETAATIFASGTVGKSTD